MANKNGMGPNDKGPRTGRGLGFCNFEGFSENIFDGRLSRRLSKEELIEKKEKLEKLLALVNNLIEKRD